MQINIIAKTPDYRNTGCTFPVYDSPAEKQRKPFGFRCFFSIPVCGARYRLSRSINSRVIMAPNAKMNADTSSSSQ